jgi:hypothetical protein
MVPSDDECKRTEKRVPFKEYVMINGALRAKAIDISEGGIYVHTGRSFKSGSTVYVSLVLKFMEIEARARVRFSHDGVGMGLRFRGLTGEQ